MKRRIIVLIDFSEDSRQLLRFAYHIAAAQKVGMLLLHQSSVPLPGFAGQEIKEKYKSEGTRESLAKLKKFAAELLGEVKGMRFKVSSSHIAETVEELFAANSTDFLFVGVKNKQLIERLFIGDTAVKLVNHTDNIIIVLPENCQQFTLKNFCVGLVEKYSLNTKAFDQVLALSGNVERIRFFSIVRPRQDLSIIKSYLSRHVAKYDAFKDVAWEIRPSSGEAAGMNEYTQENDAVLVLQKGTRKMADILRPFFVSKMLAEAKVPVIVLPQP